MSPTPANRTAQLHIVSAERRIFDGDVREVTLPSVMGEMGVLPGHAPLLAQLNPGEVRLVSADGEEDFIYVSGGLAEIQPHLITVLADTAMRGQEVDEAAALQAKRQAEEAIRTSVLYTDRDYAQAQLLKALAQLKALEDYRRKKRP